MENYVVITTRQFDDLEASKKEGRNVHRNVGDKFNCTKERFEFLKSRGAVDLVMIEKKQDAKKSTKKASKKNE